MKTKILILVFLMLIIQTNLISQTLLDELIVLNENFTDTILVKVIPIGFVFAGDRSYRSNSQFNSSEYNYHIFGGSKKIFIQSGMPEKKRFGLNQDQLFLSSGDSLIGYGNYKIEIYRSEIIEGTVIYILIDSLRIDYSDSDYPYENPMYSFFSNHFLVYYYDPDSIYVQFNCFNCEKIKLDTTDRKFEMWNQEIGNGNSYYKSQNKSGFKTNQLFAFLPINAQYYNIQKHINPNILYLNFELAHNVSTGDTLLDTINDITIKEGILFKLNSSKICSLKTPSYPALSYNNLIVEDSALLYLSSNSMVVVGNLNRLTLKNKGQITL